MTVETTTLAKFEFMGELKRGRKFEREVQKKIEELTFGTSYNNVIIDRMEFDVIVADYPLLSFVEVKAYRTDLKRAKAKEAMIKLMKNCITVTEDDSLHYRDWVPRRDKWETCGNRRWLLKKLGCTVFEGWQFRMLLIVPDKSFNVLTSLIDGSRPPFSSLIDVEGYPLLVIPKKRINDIF
jgi:hypothetical protein